MPCTATIAPRLHWHTWADGWLLLGFEHVAGRHANLAPGSPDLPLVADALTTIGRELAHCPANAAPLCRQWGRLAAWRRLAKNAPDDLDRWAREHPDQLVEWESRASDLADGDSLIHTDLHPLNLLVDRERARIVDWAWSRKGEPAVDVAFLITRLIAAGHHPEAAERWAAGLPVWRDTLDSAQTAFAVAIWGIWEYLEREHPLPHRAALTAAARQWALYRLAVT